MSIEAMRQALEYVQEFKRRWWAVPPFGNKINKATREAVSAAHSPIFQIEDALRAAIEQAEKQGQHWCTYCRGNNAHNCQFNTTIPRVHTYVTNTTAPAPRQEQPLKINPADCHIRVGEVSKPISVARQWVGLTDEDRYGLYRKAGLESYHLPSSEVQYKYDRCIESYARAIEAKLKEKNHDQ